MPTPPQQDTGIVPADVYAEMERDAAERAGVGEDQVSLVSAAAVTWSDGSLGCPEPDMMYTQALVDGYHVVLEAGGRQHSYHTDGDWRWQYCPPDRVQPPTGGDDGFIDY